MKYTYSLLFILLLSSTAFAQNQAQIVFYRDPTLSAGIGGYDIYLDSSLVGQIAEGRVQSYWCMPGEHTIRAKTKGEGIAKVNLKAGVTYYMKCSVVVDPAGGKPAFSLVSASEGKESIKKMAPSALSDLDSLSLQSRIFFYRDPKVLKSIGGYDVYVDATLIGRIEHGGTQSYASAAGEHSISAKTKGESVLKIDLKPGVTYYVECSVVVDPDGGRPELRIVSAEEGKAAMKKMSPSSAAMTAGGGEFGIKTGVNFSRFSASINSTASAVTGFHIGLYGKIPINGNFYFRPEFVYSSQGQHDDYGAAGSTTTTMNYINIPLLFETGRVVTFQFGPQVGFLLSGREKGKINGLNVDDDLSTITKSPDFSLLVGMGINPSRYFHLGVRYQYGLSNVFRTDHGLPDVANRVIHVYAAVSF